VNWDDYQAALFDLDGVVTPTAEVHMRAWREMFTDFLATRQASAPYTDDDYFRYVDGKPRYDGVRSFLVSRGIELPDGSGADETSLQTVSGLGNRKDEMFGRVLEADGVTAYPGSVALLDHLAGRSLVLAVVSSSRNAPNVLAAAGLSDRFAFVVDGKVAADAGLPGKPAPDTFLYAATRAGATAATSVVIEDAVSGVAAGRAGGFGLVVGVDRGAGADALRNAGADLVVSDLKELIA
jgi:beta-phosphoglucomutase family hydrolase